MAWSKLAVLTMLLVIIFTVSIFGGHFGYTVDGVPQGGEVNESPGILGALSWGWNGLSFLFSMTTFQVDDMPVVISTIFLLMSLVSIVVLVSMFLPGGAG